MTPSTSFSPGGPTGPGRLGRDPYAFGVGALLARSWELLRPDLLKHVGFTVTLGLAVLIFFGIAGLMDVPWLALAFTVANFAFVLLLATGPMLVAIERALGLAPAFGDFLRVRHRAGPIVLAVALQGLIPQLAGLPFFWLSSLMTLTGSAGWAVAFLLAGMWLMLYLGLGYLVTVPLVLDQDLSPWQALNASARALRGRRLTLLGLFVVLSLIHVVGTLPFGLGLLVTLPLCTLTIVAAYEALFEIAGRFPGGR